LSFTGAVELPLHEGGVPRWLIARMRRLARAIMAVVVEEKGIEEALRRLSDPLWFQAFSCVLGFDWNSSGVTTVTCGVLRAALEDSSLGLKVAGGKGLRSRRALDDIEAIGEEFRLSSSTIEEVKRASRLAAKVDNAAVQDGYALYHHAVILSEHGTWAVVQQGMNADDKTARRYHWLSLSLRSFVEEPHSGIVGDIAREAVLDMTAKYSEGCRRACVDVVSEGPIKVRRLLAEARRKLKGPMDAWIEGIPLGVVTIYRFAPDSLNWEVLKRAYEARPRSYEELLEIRGVGPSMVRALALIADLIYGEPPSWRDPVRFSFAFGGKDGVPRPVDRGLMDRVIEHLEGLLEAAELERKEKLRALERLKGMVVRVR